MDHGFHSYVTLREGKQPSWDESVFGTHCGVQNVQIGMQHRAATTIQSLGECAGFGYFQDR